VENREETSGETRTFPGMSKRIVSFCSDLIASSGPIEVDAAVGAQVRAAGLTKAADPVPRVRSALRESPVMFHLPDGRFDSARRMLDGAALTHRVRFATRGRQVLFAGPELAVLDQILVHEGSLALASGGEVLSSVSDMSGWRGPTGWLPDVPADSLLAFRLRDGLLTVEPVPGEPSLTDERVERLRAVLRRHLQSGDQLDAWRSRLTLGRVLLRALAEVPDLLAEPMPPLDEVLRLGDERWGRDWPIESIQGHDDPRRTMTRPVVLADVPNELAARIERDAAAIGMTPGEFAILQLSAALNRMPMPCRHDAEEAWLRAPYGRQPDSRLMTRFNDLYGGACDDMYTGHMDLDADLDEDPDEDLEDDCDGCDECTDFDPSPYLDSIREKLSQR
jgi:hypothetical protein